MARTPRVVIIGAGIVGCSLADELVLRGWTDVTVVEQGGCSRPAARRATRPGSSSRRTRRRRCRASRCTRSRRRHRSTLDGRWCLNPVGSLELALTPERLRRAPSTAGLRRVLGPRGPRDRSRRDGAAMAVARPDRGSSAHTTSHRTASPTRSACRRRRPAARPTAVPASSASTPSPASGPTTVGSAAVITDRGEIPADIVVCAAGIWGPRIGAMVGMTTCRSSRSPTS